MNTNRPEEVTMSTTHTAMIAEAQAKADKHEVRLIVAEDRDTGHVGITAADNLFTNVNGHEFNLTVIAVVEPTTEVK